jgi:ERCC4-type nuclease
MKFKPYTPPGASYPVKYYCTEDNAITIGNIRGAGLQVSGPDPHMKQVAIDFLSLKGIDLHGHNVSTIFGALQKKGLIYSKKSSPRNKPNTEVLSQYTTAIYSQNGPKTVETLIAESKQLELEKAPFKASTIKNVSVIVSSNEPPELLALLHRTKLINVSSGHLSEGDIVATDNKTGDTLLIERKTVQDLYQSVVTDLHSHDQCERMFAYVQARKREGKRSRAIWIVEAQEGGKHLIDNCLPEIRQVTGLINYFDMIADQSVIQSYSMEMTAYIIAKFIQGYFEQKLYYPAKTSNPSVNLSSKARLEAKAPDPLNKIVDSGVQRHTARDLVNMLAYIPSINTKVAKKLASTGRSFSEITTMSLSELKAIEGVGDTSAVKIFEDFNKKL